MGVTIHFEGRLKDEAAYQDLVNLVSSVASQEYWRSETIDLKEGTLQRVRDEQDWDYTGPTKGIVIYPHDDCEPVRFEFDKDLYFQDWTKTQFAGIGCHLKVIDLLRRVQPYFQELNVEDEGEFWETGSEETLRTHFETIQRVLEEMAREKPHGQIKARGANGRIFDFYS